MAAVNFALKDYQELSLKAFSDYLFEAVLQGCDQAFYKATGFPYRQAPEIAQGTPYVCLRVPTGGGKTIMASHAIGIAARDFLFSGNPFVLWLVPSTPILEQTVAALKDLEHPYRAALTKDFGRNVSILTKAEALALSRADAEGGACVLVSTIQSFRRDDKEGLKVYVDNGALMGHFSGLSEEQLTRLEMVEGTGRPVASLANLLRLHRPMVIVDEAHNARTSLSFDTLARFDPSLILELTATPQTDHKPNRDQYASNILHSVSAAELKAEQMIKLPIRLTTDRDWRNTVGAALDCRAMLEEAATHEEAETGEYIRPIVLFQAQAQSRTDPHRITVDVLKSHLIENNPQIASQIAVVTGNKSEIDDHDLTARDCPIRFIITVQKLKEGWDCPFAYVLCSVAEQTSKTAIEQILGRVLRMPKARLKRRDALNRAYAFVASKSFDDAAMRLRDGLVEGAGFNRLEADDVIARHGSLDFDPPPEDAVTSSDALDEDAVALIDDIIESLPSPVRARVTYDQVARTIGYRGPMTREARNVLQLAAAKSREVESKIGQLYVRSNQFQLSGAIEEQKPAFVVPRLCMLKQGELRLFGKEHYLDLPWRLDQCDPKVIINKFRPADESQTGQIDISDKGRVEIAFVRRMQGELAAVIQEPAWSEARLANWLDSGIPHPDVTKPSAIIFISGAIQALMEQGHSLDELARHKYDLRKSLAGLIAELRKQREDGNYDALFAADASQFATSSDIGLIFDELTYAYNQPYAGTAKFNKHYTTLIGDLKPKGEEFDCALYLDRHDEVRYWIRNVENKASSFWLQLPSAKFYPDFLAMLKDGRILAVEYKGGHLYAAEEAKRTIGRIWAEASGGQCLFCMPTERQFDEIDRTIRTNQ